MTNEEKSLVQAELMRFACGIEGEGPEGAANCLGEWVSRYADNVPQLTREEIDKIFGIIKRKAPREEMEAVLEEVQARLEELDKKFG